MAQFDDHHRTVVGHHGTGLRAALRVVNRIEGFRWSRRDFDWLGHGIYFWEHAPEQALNFARIRRAFRAYNNLPFSKKIDMMVETGLITEDIANRARAKLAEIAAEEAAAAAGAPSGAPPRPVDEVAASVPEA